MGPHLKYNYNTDLKLKQAMEAIRHGASFTVAHRMSGISPMTLRKYYDKYIAEYGLIPITETVRKPDINIKPDFHRVFTYDQEIAFKELLKDFQDLFYGLSEKELRILAYQMAALNDSKMPIDWRYGMAAVDWVLNFKSRHRDLNIEKPERCGYKKTRSVVCEKKNVNKFYSRLEKHLLANGLLTNSSRIFSLDETYTSPYPEKRKDKGSKGDLITTCCIVCSDGTSLPPVIILPHAFTNSCSLPGAMTLTASHGRMTAEFFPEVMQHFINHSKTSPENPSALILDIDSCHLSITTLNLAKTNGVHLVTYHPHVSKKLQPLEVGLLDLFQTHYYECLEQIYTQNEVIVADRTSVDISKVVGEAFEKAITPENIKEAFRKCGIQPFDTDLLTDSDYESCLTADQACYDCKSRNMISRRHAIQSPDSVGVSAEIAGEESNDGQDEVSEDSTDPGDSSQSWKSNEPDMGSVSKMPRGDKSAELDKLKRRMIRTVARLLKEKKPEEELWKELKKETGGNCRQLWERMRSLTMKKLKRLFDADDRVDLVPNVARMTLTDWLMYDLVLVHEKIDVIHRNESSSSPSKVLSNLFSLVQMFSIEGRSGNDLADAWTAATVHYNSKGHQCSPMLMQRRWYQIKELTRHKMYKFWFNYRGNQRLLAHANQDPPTELQKAIALRYPEIITHTFPEWRERIDSRLVIMPEEFEIKMRKKSLMKPTDENAPDVVIVERKVDTITLQDSDSEYSDVENSRDSNVTSLNSNNVDNEEAMQIPIIVQVKTEPQDPNENIYEATYPQDEPTDRFHDEIERLILEEQKILSEDDDTSRDAATPNQAENQDVLPLTTNTTKAIDIEKENPVEQEISKTVATGETELKTIENNADIGSQDSILIDDDDEEMNPVQQLSPIQPNTQETDSTENKVIDITSPNAKLNTKDYSHETGGVVIVESNAPISSLENLHNNESIIHNEYANTEEVQLPIITGIASGSQVVAKLEYIAEMQSENYEANENDVVLPDLIDQPKMEIDTDMLPDTAGNMEVIDLQDSSDNPGDENIPSIEPVQNKQDSQRLHVADEVIDVTLAEGIEFADDGIEYDDDECQHKEGINETPNLPGGENSEGEKEIPPKFDLKLLMNPVVYSTKLDEMTVYKRRSLFNTIVEKEVIDKIILESKPISSKSINNVIPEQNSVNEHEDKTVTPVSYEQCLNENDNFIENKICANQGAEENQYATEEHTFEADDDLFHNNACDEYESDDSVEIKKVKLSSNILKKPRTLSYNPIQICKNPDFNTRLKRLTVGFFTSSRNRVLLSACKPMTIDLSKAFESKLVNGTMYLTPSDPAVKIEKDVNVTQSLASIMPSANPVQSLINTTDVDRILQEELKKRVLERNKTINLPNISVVRQINQQLLMAEVAPIMAITDKTVSAAPPDILSKADSLKNTTSHFNDDINGMGINNGIFTKQHSDLKHNEPSSKPRENIEYSNETEKKPNENPTNEANEIQPMADRNKSKHGKRKIVQNMPNWITKNYYDIKDSSDSLLTIDTLYKMLNALDPCQEYASKFSSKSKTKHKSSDTDKSKPQKELTYPKPKAVNVSKLNSDIATPKRRRNKRSCCWAKSKIEKLTTTVPGYIRLSKHKCQPGNCLCCCSIELRQLELEIEHVRTSKAVDSLSEVIEGVVQQSRDSINISSAVHIVNVDANVNTDPQPRMKRDIGLQANLSEGETVQIIDNFPNTTTNTDPDNTVIDQPGNAVVTINIDEDDENEQSKMKSPVPKIRVYSGNSMVREPPKPRCSKGLKDTSVINNPENVLMKPKSKSDKKPYRSVFPVIAQIQENQFLAEADKQNEVIEKSGDNFPCSCRLSVPNVAVDTSSATLLLDGSNPCLQHNFNNSKETKIYLNRKHMSVTERPFYVGKNKILLTNIKQPKPISSDPQLIPDPAPMTSQDTPVTSPCFTLPPGVNLVMLPNDTISYTVDPKVILTHEQINAMPIILQAVQLKMKASGITLPEDSSSGQKCDNNTISTDNDNVENVNSSAETSNSENTILDDELRLHTNKANVDVCSPLSASMQTGNGDTSKKSYFIRELESQYVYNNEQTHDSSEILLTEPYESIQKLNEHGNIIVSVMNPTGLQAGVNLQSTSNEANIEIVANTSNIIGQSELQNSQDIQSEASITSEVVKNTSDETKELHVQNQNNAENTNEANIASENVTNNTNQNSTNECNTTSKVDNTEISDTALNNAPEEEVVTASIVMAEPLVQSNTKQQSGNASNTVSKKIVNLTDEVNATTATGNEVVNNVEPIALETSDIEHSTGQTSSIANAFVEKSESNECINAIEKSSELNKLEGSAVETKNSGVSSRRNLFSDLMEMSGIGEEDMAPAETAIPEPHEPLLGIPGDVLQPPVLSIDPVPSLLHSDFSVPLPSVSPISQNKPLISAQIDEKIHELNPITSFAELKYACDNNGLFFKLDLSNGTIVPINVCIQKSPQVATKNVYSTEDVIDLTNEQGVSFNEESPPSNTVVPTLAGDKAKQTTAKIIPKKLSSLMPESSSQNTNISPSNLSTLLPVRLSPRTETRAHTISTSKPIKLLPRPDKKRTNYSKMIAVLTEESYKNAGTSKIIPQKIDSTVQKREELRKSLSNNLKPLKTLESHKPNINILRKTSTSTRRILQNLHKIEAKIDLVDSDAPMEEEYLVEDSSDDSDDEPLAKVAKKMRSNQNEDNQETYNNPLDEESQDESIHQDEVVPEDVEDIDFEEAIDAIDQPLHRRPTIDTEPVPTQLLLSGEALKQPIPLNNSYVDSHENEDSQEDCILGV